MVDRSSEREANIKVKQKDEEGVAEQKDNMTAIEVSNKAIQTYDADENVEVGEDKSRHKDKEKLNQRGIVCKNGLNTFIHRESKMKRRM